MFRNLVFVLMLALNFPAKGQVIKESRLKVSPELAALSGAKGIADSIDVSVSVKKGFVIKLPVRILSTPLPGFLYVVRLPLLHLALLEKEEKVLFINRHHIPKEEINTGASDPTLNLITYAHHRFPNVLGTAVRSSLKERLFDTTDIDLKGRVFSTGLGHNSTTTHASLMATIMAGAANSSPFAIGAAPGAFVSPSSFSNLFPDPDPAFQNAGITVQNHSYGTIVESFYGNEAVAYDQSAVNNPALLHVFSAGNAGTATITEGTYAGVPGMANLTGNFKHAKNILTVGAVDSAGKLSAGSSRGPAHDGRVKPELVAYGEDGSSGAAALTSGTAILVQDLYQQLRGGTFPSSALTKAVLLNSSTDVGEKQVDFLSGYGLLNAYQALQTIKDERYVESSLVPGETKTMSITVPANAKGLKLTLAWTDQPARPNASKALVNDLDLVLRSATGESWLPWVLNHQPPADQLLQPAQRKKDTLNNIEQVTVESPAAGMYTIEVRGTAVTTASQDFAIAYAIDTAGTFYWTFPTASDQLVAGQRHHLRWQTNVEGQAKIEFATKDDNWREIGNVDSLAKNYLTWQVPDTATTARLRLTAGTKTIVSDSFTISRQLSVQTGFHCEDSFLLYWHALPANQYRLYRLGEKYLEPLTTLPDTAIVLSKSQNPSLFYSIAPLINGKEGIRSSAVNYTVQGVGCYLRSFYLQSQTENRASFTAELGTVYQVAEVTLEKFSGTSFQPVKTIQQPQTTGFSFSDLILSQGENQFRLKIKLANGQVLYSAIETAYAVTSISPVLVYPNPVSHNSTLKILVREVGRYTLLIYDATGRQVFQILLNSTITPLSSNRFVKGLHFLRIVDRDNKDYRQKLVVF